MDYYSTNNKKTYFDINEAVIKGLAEDKGLFMPNSIPLLSNDFFENIQNLSLQEIAYEVLKEFFLPRISKEKLEKIITEAFNFEIPLNKIEKDISVLELFYGPTSAFKDVGARFLARILADFVENMKDDVYVLAATSGDTGGAVANGFLNVPGIKVIVLYPKGMVSERQEAQFTTLGQNIIALEVKGTFDDCQALVKEAFLNKSLNEKLFLTSANSINIARLLPQAVYYFYAYAQMKKTGEKKKIVFSIPSGNFGNLTAGLLALKMGLPIKRFIAATNINDVIPEYLKTGVYTPRPSVQTLANAMDVGDPSNFVRILDLFDNDFEKMKQVLSSFVLNDNEIRITIKEEYEKFNYVLDPHGACACKALKNTLQEDETGIFLATAHPAKFPDVVEEEISKEIPLPQSMQQFMNKEKIKQPISKSFEDFKRFLSNL